MVQSSFWCVKDETYSNKSVTSRIEYNGESNKAKSNKAKSDTAKIIRPKAIRPKVIQPK